MKWNLVHNWQIKSEINYHMCIHKWNFFPACFLHWKNVAGYFLLLHFPASVLQQEKMKHVYILSDCQVRNWPKPFQISEHLFIGFSCQIQKYTWILTAFSAYWKLVKHTSELYQIHTDAFRTPPVYHIYVLLFSLSQTDELKWRVYTLAVSNKKLWCKILQINMILL